MYASSFGRKEKPSAATPKVRIDFIVLLFIVALALPQEFSFWIGSANMSPYRVMLILLSGPVAFRFFSSRNFRMKSFDWLFVAYIAWSALATVVNGGNESAAEATGIFILEMLIPYFLARLWVTDVEKFLSLARFLIGFVLILPLFTLPEALTGVRYLHDMASSITGVSFPRVPEIRMGIYRSAGPFDHQILYGTFCASVFALSWYLTKSTPARLMRAVIISGATLLAASSAPILALIFQILLIAYEYVTRKMKLKNRWLLLFVGFVVLYIAIDLLSNRTPLHVIVAYMTLKPFTGYIRILIWEYGIQAVLGSPLFGIGFSDWARPIWLTPSVDSIWLLTAMRYGIPGVLLFLSSILSLMTQVGKAQISSPTEKTVRLAWSISVATMIGVGFTVHYWAAMGSFFVFIVGAGAWMTNGKGRPSLRVNKSSVSEQPSLGNP